MPPLSHLLRHAARTLRVNSTITDRQVSHWWWINPENFRLSSIASDRMTHENVNIADLSDADRPTKLQEVYSELYDNEWTDAYEELTNHQDIPEQDAIKTLMDILMISFQKCREITWGRYERLICAVSSVDIVQGTCLSSTKKNPAKGKMAMNERNMNAASNNKFENEEGKDDAKEKVDSSHSNVRDASKGILEQDEEKNAANENAESAKQNADAASKDNNEAEKDKHVTSTITLHIDQEKQIKDIWRTTTTALKNEAVKHLYLILLTSFDIPIKDLENTSKYLTSCIDLCWKMGFQEKPMYLDVVAEKDINSEKMFDEDKFKAYTKSGERVDFVVWPALFLNEGGPMLFKGIAQGCKKSD